MNVVQFFLRCISLVEEHKMSLHDYVYIFIYIAIAPSYLLAKLLLEFYLSENSFMVDA